MCPKATPPHTHLWPEFWTPLISCILILPIHASIVFSKLSHSHFQKVLPEHFQYCQNPIPLYLSTFSFPKLKALCVNLQCQPSKTPTVASQAVIQISTDSSQGWGERGGKNCIYRILRPFKLLINNRQACFWQSDSYSLMALCIYRY